MWPFKKKKKYTKKLKEWKIHKLSSFAMVMDELWHLALQDEDMAKYAKIIPPHGNMVEYKGYSPNHYHVVFPVFEMVEQC